MTQALNIRALDVTGQLEKHVRVPQEASVADLVDALVDELALPTNDVNGDRIVYHLRSEKSGAQLSPADTAADVLEQDETVRLMPEIVPGSGR